MEQQCPSLFSQNLEERKRRFLYNIFAQFLLTVLAGSGNIVRADTLSSLLKDNKTLNIDEILGKGSKCSMVK